MKTKEEIYSEMVLQAPWYIDDHLEPYILEAMQVFAESYYKERTQANDTKTSHDKALHKHNVTVVKRKVNCVTCKHKLIDPGKTPCKDCNNEYNLYEKAT